MHEPGSMGRWRSLIDAAVALRVSPDTVRRRACRGELPSRHHERGRLLVELAADTPAPIGQAHSGDHELPRLRDRVALLERERAMLTDELAARRQSETELRALLSQAPSIVARIVPPAVRPWSTARLASTTTPNRAGAGGSSEDRARERHV